MRRPTSTMLALALTGGALPLGASALGSTATATAADPGRPGPSVVGRYGKPFEQPKGINCLKAKTEAPKCKPAAMAMAALPNQSVLYYDGLEGMRNVDYNVVLEFSNVAENDQSRVMELFGRRTPRWSTPTPEDGGANPDGNDANGEYLPGVPHNDDNLATTATCSAPTRSSSPTAASSSTGGTQLLPRAGRQRRALRRDRARGPAQQPDLRPADQEVDPERVDDHGRWYPDAWSPWPTARCFVASGVTKLIKPVYPDRPLDSGTNVKQTEVYDPHTGQVAREPATAPTGRCRCTRGCTCCPTATSTTTRPARRSTPRASPTTRRCGTSRPPTTRQSKTWTDLGVPDDRRRPARLPRLGFSVMLPLTPDKSGNYTKATFLSGGGVIGVSPGTYLATDTATLNTVDTARGDALTSRPTGKLNRPRWYGTGIVLPTGEVYLANGASADEVVVPGCGQADHHRRDLRPEDRPWRDAGQQSHGRTYHNTAMLLPDGRVLVGGHAPIATGYSFQTDAGHEAIGLSKSGHDPSFEIYSPPYLFRGTRPRITKAPGKVRNGSRFTLTVKSPSRVKSVRLVRNTSLTHLIDGDQRSVVLDVVKRRGKRITVRVPDRDVLPAGPYMLFANRGSKKGEIPSKATQTFVR